jgi:pyruvate dehydrogenase E1 component alpha subunit
VYDAAGRAVGRARRGEGPSLIEVHTVRLWGHFEGDAQGYRPDRDTVAQRDPLPAYRARLLAAGVLTDAQADAIDAQATARVEQALEFARSSPRPDPAAATSYVFASKEEA